MTQNVILDHNGRPFKRDAETLRPRASIDAAKTNDENKRHWASADSLGPNAAYDEVTRSKLRSRGRYEHVNNSYVKGMVRQQAYDLIGTGPRPQIGNLSPDVAKTIEASYGRWARAAMAAIKFRLMEKATYHSGDIFALMDTDLSIRHPVKLQLRLAEAEQCQTPWRLASDPRIVDGVKVNESGSPVEYYFLREHPGESNGYSSALGEYVTIPASQVLHWRELDRPGQVRGIPKITPSLPLFSQLRRVRLATLTAIEFAAMLAGIMKTNLPPEAGVASPGDWSLFELVRGALLTLPEGWDAHQFKPEQPVASFEMFNREILNEAGRATGAPLNIVTGNSSGYNFSSGRLDHLPYQRGLAIDRDDFRTVVLDPLFEAWAEEARMAGIVPAGAPPIEEWAVSWNWDGFDSIDQVKDAQADDMRLKNGTTTFKEIHAAYGQDADEQLDQLAREVEEWRRRGLKHPLDAAAATAPIQQDPPPQDDGEDPPPPANGRNGHHRNGFALGGVN